MCVSCVCVLVVCVHSVVCARSVVCASCVRVLVVCVGVCSVVCASCMCAQELQSKGFIALRHVGS